MISRILRYTFKKKFKTPPYLIFFVTSACNSRCQHCFYWRNLNQKKDLSLAEIKKISASLEKIDKLLLSGGEPFLRPDLPEIVKLFFEQNQVKVLAIPTNGLLPELIVSQLKKILKYAGRKREVFLCISLDGTEKTHDWIRGVKGNFKKVVKLYRQLQPLEENFPNLRVQFNATVSNQNYKDLFSLIDQFEKLFPGARNTDLVFSFLRGNPPNKNYFLPSVEELKKLYAYREKRISNKSSLWERLVDEITFEFRLKTLEEQKQLIPCEAGNLIGVILDDGKVALCEMLPPLGNLRKMSFSKIWNSVKARKARQKIKKGECFCYHECFLPPSLLAHPFSIFKLFLR